MNFKSQIRLANFGICAMFLFANSVLAFESSSRQWKLLDFAMHASVSPPSTTGQGADDRRQQSLEQGNHPLISLNLNLDALAQSGAAPRAQELLTRIHALHQEGYYEVSPDIVSYNSVLKAWKEDDNPSKAYELLQEMLLANEFTSDIHVDVISFNTVILAFAKTGNYPQAEDLLRQMQIRDDLPDPDTVTFNGVLHAYAQSREQGSAILAENLLKEMMAPKSNVTVDTTSFNTVIHAWSQVADRSAVEAAHRAQQLLDHMDQLAAAGNSNVEPDVYGYTTCIQAWARCGQPLRSQKLLDRMTLEKGLIPNRFTYTAVISSLAKAGNPEAAETILDGMMDAYIGGNVDLKPDTIAFSSVMDGWAKFSCTETPFAAERALLLLQRMKELKHDGMAPNAVTYISALSAVAKSGTWEACEKARDILNAMEAEYKNGNNSVQPTNIHYNTVLHAYARSPRADKALKAAGFMKSMEKHPRKLCHPDIISYNSLLMACANAFGNAELKERSFAIAIQAFKRALSSEDQGIRPTSTTFVHFCKSARRLLKQDKQRSVLRKVLLLCCQKGLLNQVVLQQVQQACKGDEEWREVAGELSQYVGLNEKLKPSQVPKRWVCNARR